MPASDEIYKDEFADNMAQNNTEEEIINLKAKVEAVLFITARAMQPVEIAELLNLLWSLLSSLILLSKIYSDH